MPPVRGGWAVVEHGNLCLLAGLGTGSIRVGGLATDAWAVDVLDRFLNPAAVDLDPLRIAINLVLAAALAWVLARVYVRFGRALSNRDGFAANFVLLATTTTLIITIVKSSLALSLGLVGALSIVRFRAAIKEPEELAYLFLCIAIGLGMGADQRQITMLALALILLWVVLRGIRTATVGLSENLHLTISTEAADRPDLKDLIDALRGHARSLNLRRYDESDGRLEAAFLVELSDHEQLAGLRDAVRELAPSAQITFVDQRGIL